MSADRHSMVSVNHAVVDCVYNCIVPLLLARSLSRTVWFCVSVLCSINNIC